MAGTHNAKHVEKTVTVTPRVGLRVRPEAFRFRPRFCFS